MPRNFRDVDVGDDRAVIRRLLLVQHRDRLGTQRMACGAADVDVIDLDRGL